MAPSGVLGLSSELLRNIIDCIEADPDKLVNLERRAYLSTESFRAPVRPTHSRARDLSNLRLTCKRFAELGAIHQFGRVATRFSHHGFTRLENIAKAPQVAKHVRKFCYLVPNFFGEGDLELITAFINHIRLSNPSDARTLNKKASEQRAIIRGGEDVRVLQLALNAFTGLQHVQILRLLDEEDEALLRPLRMDQDLSTHVISQWAHACSHSTRTLGEALLESRSPFSRFSSPMLNTQSAELLAQGLPGELRILASRLTSLELHFDEGQEVDEKLTSLSDVFRSFFAAAENLQAIHLGFPSHRPISIPLQQIFHKTQWRRLTAFGIQGWKLDADEIIQLVGLHKDRLRGLRLRDVFLKDGSLWKDVLGFLRSEIPSLNWVSLRRINYAQHFDNIWNQAGVEIPDDQPGGTSDSEEDDSDRPSVHSDDGNDEEESSTNDEDEDSDASSTAESDQGRRADLMEFPELRRRSATTQWCTCGGHGSPFAPVDEFGDNGLIVSNTQRKLWEKWVIRRCIEHDERG